MKIFEGKVISIGMEKTVVVEVFRITPHPLYRKLVRRSKKYKVDNTGFENVGVGTAVRITETKPISKNKYFKILGVVGPAKQTLKVSNLEKNNGKDSEKVEAKTKIKKSAAKKTAKKETK